MPKRMIRYLRTVRLDTNKLLKRHNSLTAAKEYAQKQANKLGVSVQAIDEYGVYFTAQPKQKNPASHKPPKGWIRAKAVKISRKGGKVIVEVRK